MCVCGKYKLCILYNLTRTRGNNLYTQMRMAQNDRPGGYTTSTSINLPTIPTHLRHLVGHLRHLQHLQHLPQAQAGLPPTSRSLSIFDVPHTSKFVSSQHVSYFVAICCNTIIPRQTACLKPPVTVEIHSVTFSSFFACSLLPMDWCGHTKALSGYPLQTSSNMVESCYVMLGYVRLNQKMSNAVKHSQTLSNASDSKLLVAEKCFRFKIFR